MEADMDALELGCRVLASPLDGHLYSNMRKLRDKWGHRILDLR